MTDRHWYSGALLGLCLAATGTSAVAADSVTDICAEPLPWRVGDVDPRFNIEPEDFAREVRMAAEHWNEAAGRLVLVHDEHRGFPVHLEYDQRQEQAREVVRLGRELEQLRDRAQSEDDRLGFDQSAWEDQRDAHRTRIQAFERKLHEHNRRVENLNRGGGQSGDRAAIERQGRELAEQRRQLTTEGDRLSAAADHLTRRVERYNALVARINRKVAELNAATARMPERSGEYRAQRQTDWRGNLIRIEREISIYFYFRDEDLRLTLAHELGHALGLDHVDDPEAVMHASYTVTDYRYSEPLQLSGADVRALQALCATGR